MNFLGLANGGDWTLSLYCAAKLGFGPLPGDLNERDCDGDLKDRDGEGGTGGPGCFPEFVRLGDLLGYCNAPAEFVRLTPLGEATLSLSAIKFLALRALVAVPAPVPVFIRPLLLERCNPFFLDSIGSEFCLSNTFLTISSCGDGSVDVFPPRNFQLPRRLG